MPSYLPFPPALHAQMETQIDFLDQLSRHAFEALGRLGELNMQAARRLADDGIRLGRALAACNDPVQVGNVAMREAQPAFEHWRDWQTGLMGVLATGNARFARDANEGGWQAARRGAEAVNAAAQAEAHPS